MRPLESAAVVICALLLAPLVLALVQRTRIRLNFDYAMKVVANEAVRRAKQEHQVMLYFSPASTANKNAPMARGVPFSNFDLRISDLSTNNPATAPPKTPAASASAMDAAACAAP